MRFQMLFLPAAAVALSACAQNQGGGGSALATSLFGNPSVQQANEKVAQTGITGTIIGATGSPVGATFVKGAAQPVSVGVGTAVGAWADSDLGKALDSADQERLRTVGQYAMEMQKPGATSQWSDAGHKIETVIYTGGFSSLFVPGGPCRAFDQSLTIGGKIETVHGRACKDASGTWKVAG